MKKFLLAIILFLSMKGLYAQYDPFVTSVDIQPAPIQFEAGAAFSFATGNLGFLPLSNLAQPMRISVSLANGIPANLGNPLASVSGHEAFFNVQYFVEANTLFFTQKTIIPTPLDGGITQIIIQYQPTDTTNIQSPFNGMQVNVIPPAYTNGNGNIVDNDAASIFTWTTTTILPIELSSFTVKQEKCDINLKWETLSELNNDYFTIFKSSDAVNWNPIAKVKGAGNSLVPQTYSFIDKDIEGQSELYYKLSQTDFDGITTSFKILSVENNTCTKSNIRIYPNPSSNMVLVDFQTTSLKTARVNIFDLSGKLMFSKRVEKSIMEVDVRTFPAGAYLFKVENEEETYSHQVVVQK